MAEVERPIGALAPTARPDRGPPVGVAAATGWDEAGLALPAAVAERLRAAGARPGVPLAPYTSLKIGGPADLFAVAAQEAELTRWLRLARELEVPVRFLGGGTNLLVSDAGVAGLVVRVASQGFQIAAEGDRATLIAAAGTTFAALARRLARLGWAGLEWAVNVPGTVGGAVVNNAGAFGSCVAERLLWARLVDASGRTFALDNAELGYAYRTSRLKRRELGPVVVLEAAFALRRAPAEQLLQAVAETQARRTATQPRQLSAGSVFANPPGEYAGRLIEAAGLKGARAGGAQISPQHANFIVNLGGATAADVYQLIVRAQRAVWERFGIWLTLEQELVGRWTAAELGRLGGPAGGG